MPPRSPRSKRAKRDAEKAAKRSKSILAEGGKAPIATRTDYYAARAMYLSVIRKIISESKTTVTQLFDVPDDGFFSSAVQARVGIGLTGLREKIDGIVGAEAFSKMSDLYNELNNKDTLRFNRMIEKISREKIISPGRRAENVNDIVRNAVKRNVSLIKNVGESHYNKIENIVLNAVNGQGNKSAMTGLIREALPGANAGTEKRAKLIARDQLNKNLNALSLAKMQGAGVDSYKWQHGNSREPRPWHIGIAPNGLNHGVFKISEPPVIDPRTGERGVPGQLINCSCFAIPVITAD